MKYSTIKLLLIELTLILITILNIFLININNYYFIAFFLSFFSIFTILILGFEKNRKRFKKDNIMNIIIYVLVYQILLYLSGLLFGFLKSGYNLGLSNIIQNVFPIILFFLAVEFLRYCINSKGQNNFVSIVLSIIFFVLLDISLQLYMFDFTNKSSYLELACLVIIPSISKNILLTYLSIKFGYEGNVIYLILMYLPVYLIPIIPNINVYLTSILELVFPLILLDMMYKLYMKKNEMVIKNKLVNRIITIVLLTFCVIVVSLTSGIFPYFSLSIGSESMVPYLDKGDVVIVKKVKDKNMDDIKEGNVLIYKHNKKIIVHRVKSIIQENKYYSFITKGDNNDLADEWIVTEENIIGVEVFKIKYIGYPTIWLNEAMN